LALRPEKVRPYSGVLLEEEMLSNNSYNIVTQLSEKSQALELYDEFIEDAEDADSPECVELWQKMRVQDEALVEELKQHVEMLVQNDKF